MRAKIPVTVATGFLGSGKTTLINHILTAEHGKKIAVIENEYGEISIDQSLVKQKLGSNEEIFELNNGCICCKVRGDLIRVLEKLLRRKQKMDAILIETTGLADPGPVIQTFFTDDNLKDHLQLDAVLCVVDAKHCLQHIQKDSHGKSVTNEAVQQIAFADKILLNKVDLVSDIEKADLIRVVKGINSQAQLLECKLNVAPPEIGSILSLRAFDLDRILEANSSFLQTENEVGDEVEPHGHHHQHDCGDTDCKHEHHHHGPGHSQGHQHDTGVTSVALQKEGTLNAKLVNGWLGELLQNKGPDLFRSKGILNMGDGHKTVFQGVHNMWQFSSSEEGVGQPWKEGERRINQLVFIGKNLDKHELEASLNSCFVDS